MWTGAFNDAFIHYRRLIPLYQEVGDVYVVRYARKRFSSHDAMLEAYNEAKARGYGEILLIGASLGGEVALRFVAHASEQAALNGYNPAIKLIACDVPLGGQHLPAPGWLLRLARHIHIGPLFNLLSPLVTPLMFKKLKESEAKSVDHEHWAEHMRGMRGYKLSTIVEMIAAMATQPPFTDVDHVPTVYLQCVNDDVIKGDEAANDWKKLMGSRLKAVVQVDAGHVQFVENHKWWYKAHRKALEILDYTVAV